MLQLHAFLLEPLISARTQTVRGDKCSHSPPIIHLIIRRLAFDVLHCFTNISSTLFPGPIYGQLIPTSELSHTNKASISRRKHHDQLKKFSLRCFRKGWSRKIRYFERQICHVLTLERVCLCLKPSACRETKLFCLPKRSCTDQEHINFH